MLQTGEDIRRRAIRMADEIDPVSGASDWTDSQELLDLVNEALATLHGHLVEHAPDNVTRRTTVTVPSGAESTTVEGLHSVREVFWIRSGARTQARSVDLVGIGAYSTDETSDCPDYRLVGNVLCWFPAPAGNLTAEIWHILSPRVLESITEEIGYELPPGWERFVVAYVAQYLCDKAETDSRPAQLAQQRALDSIIAQARGRQPAGTVRNVHTGGTSLQDRKSRLPRP